MPGCRRPSETDRYSGSEAASWPNSSRQPVRKRATLSRSSATSLTGRRTSFWRLAALRWVSGSKLRMLSMVSPNRSRRTGSAAPEAKMSTMPPRMANSPGSITVAARP